MAFDLVPGEGGKVNIIIQPDDRGGIALIEALESGFHDATIESQKFNSSLRDLSNQGQDNLGRLTKRLIELAAAFEGLRAIDAFVRKGLEFNQTIESSTLGIASLIDAEGKLIDSQGRLLTGTAALGAAQGLAADQITKLRIAGIQTAASTEQLVDAFQQAVGAGVQAGLSLDQIRGFTVQIAQAALAIGLPFNQLNQEVRSILNATIDRNSRIAKALQLTNEEVRLAREQGQLAQFLNEKFQAFTVAGGESVKTMRALRSNLENTVQLFSGETVAPLFDAIKKAGSEVFSSVFDFKNAKVSGAFSGFVKTGQDFFREIGSAMADGVSSAIAGSKEFSGFLQDNKNAIHDTNVELGLLARQIGNLVGSIVSFGVHFAASAATSKAFNIILETGAGIARLFADNIGLIAVALTGIYAKSLVALALANPIGTAVTLAVTLLGLLESIRHEREAEQEKTLRGNALYGEQAARLQELATQYKTYSDALGNSKLPADQAAQARLNLADATKQILELEPELRKTIGATGVASNEAARAVQEAADARVRAITDTAEAQTQALDQAKTKLAGVKEALKQADPQSRLFLNQQKEQLTTDIAFYTQSLHELGQIVQNISDAQARARLAAAGLAATFEPVSPTSAITDKNDPVQIARGKLDAVKRDVAAQKAQLTAQFKDGMVDYQEYYGGLLKLTNQQIDAEENLQKAMGEVAKAKQDKGGTEQARIQFLGLENDREKAAAQTSADIIKFDQETAKVRADILSQLYELEGKQAESAAQKIAKTFQGAMLQAFQAGDLELVADIMQVILLKTQKETSDLLQQQAREASSAGQARLQQIQNLQRTGAVGQAEAQRLTADAYREQISRLTVLLQQKEALHVRDQQTLDDNQKLRLEIETLNADLLILTDTMTKVKVAAQDDLETGFTNVISEAFKDLEGQTSDISAAFSNMAKSVVNDINQIIAKMIALAAVKAALEFAGTVLADVIFGSNDLVFADGGPVTGPGGPRSDNIHAMLSPGEFVVNARGYAAFPEAVEAINDFGRYGMVRNTRRYADGGLVGSPAGRGGGAAGARVDVGLSDDLVPVAISGRKGSRAVLQVIQQNKATIKRMMGG